MPPKAPLLTAKTLTFERLCNVFESIEALGSGTGKKGGRTGVMEARKEKLSNLWKQMEVRAEDFYQIMRLTIPTYDTQRSTYGFKESKLALLYVDMLSLPPDSHDAIRFRSWKDPSKNNHDTTRFSDVVYKVLLQKGYARVGQARSVFEVNELLDDFAAAIRTDERKRVAIRLLRSLSPVEQKWVIRIILKEMKMQMNETSVLAAFTPGQNAKAIFDNTNDLKLVCERCTDHNALRAMNIGYGKDDISLFRPLKPMMASVMDEQKLKLLLHNGPFAAEAKFDGERNMIHFSRSHGIRYWTRNATEYTHLYGKHFDSTLLKQMKPHVSDCILDGEILVYDAEAKRFQDFGSLKTFANSDGTSGKEWLCYEAFDIIFLNGECLKDKPLDERRKLLVESVDNKPTHLEIVTQTAVHSIRDVQLALDLSMEKGYEGIILKDPCSSYIPAERKLKWQKLKPDHIKGMSDTLDLVVLGGYYGTKFGARGITHFLLGVWDPDSGNGRPDSETAKYITVCKVGTGYQRSELEDMRNRLAGNWITTPNAVPPWLGDWKPAADDRPDEYIHPKDSLVLEIFGYSFTITTKFLFGKTVRFPRMSRMRLDKSIAEATDLKQLDRIAETSLTVSKKAAELGDFEMMKTAKRKHRLKQRLAGNNYGTLGNGVMMPERTIAVVDADITTPEAKEVNVVSDLFKQFEFCVLFTTTDVISQRRVELMVMENGGTVVAHPQKTTSVLLASTDRAAKVQNWIKMCTDKHEEMKEKYPYCRNVVHVSWVERCVHAKKVLPFMPIQMIHTTPELETAFREELDQYNDHYTVFATVASLRESLRLFDKRRATVVRDPSATPTSGNTEGPGAEDVGSKRQRETPEDEDDADDDDITGFDETTRRVMALRMNLGLEEECGPMAAAVVAPIRQTVRLDASQQQQQSAASPAAIESNTMFADDSILLDSQMPRMQATDALGWYRDITRRRSGRGPGAGAPPTPGMDPSLEIKIDDIAASGLLAGRSTMSAAQRRALLACVANGAAVAPYLGEATHVVDYDGNCVAIPGAQAE